MRIVRVEEKDLGECARLIRRSFLTIAEEFGFTAEKDPKFTAFCVTEEVLLRQLRGERRPIFACVDGGKLAGYYSLRLLNGEVELCNLCTAPEFRHRKIGESLLLHAFDRARERGFSEMVIGVVDANERVKRWYESYGFRKSGECDEYDTFHCIYMNKNLEDTP